MIPFVMLASIFANKKHHVTSYLDAGENNFNIFYDPLISTYTKEFACQVSFSSINYRVVYKDYFVTSSK
jgi:hypothetical protein